MYRALTLKAINNNIDPEDEGAVLELAKHTSIELSPSAQGPVRVLLDNNDVSIAIRERASQNTFQI